MVFDPLFLFVFSVSTIVVEVSQERAARESTQTPCEEAGIENAKQTDQKGQQGRLSSQKKSAESEMILMQPTSPHGPFLHVLPTTVDSFSLNSSCDIKPEYKCCRERSLDLFVP